MRHVHETALISIYFVDVVVFFVLVDVSPFVREGDGASRLAGVAYGWMDGDRSGRERRERGERGI